MSSDDVVVMDSISKFSIMDVTVWYKCGVCHGYFHSIPMLKYHYLVDHKMNRLPRISGNPPPGALKGKIYTRCLPSKPPPPIRSHTEPTAASAPPSTSNLLTPSHVNEIEVLEAASCSNVEEMVVEAACNQPDENPIPSPSDSGIHDGGSYTNEEEHIIAPATPPTVQTVVPASPLELTNETDNVTSETATNTHHDVTQESSGGKCTICNKQYSSLGALNFHIKKEHTYQVVSGSSEYLNGHDETSPPKLVLKMTKNTATATSTSSTIPLGGATLNSANPIVPGRRRSSRLMSAESSSSATPQSAGDAISLSALHMGALNEAVGESNMDYSVNIESHYQTAVENLEDTSKDKAEAGGLSDSSKSSTSTIARTKQKRNGSFISSSSSSSSDWDVDIPKVPKKNMLLTTSDSEQSESESVHSSPPRSKKPLGKARSTSPQASSAAEENSDMEDTEPQEDEPGKVLKKPEENEATHADDEDDEPQNVEMRKKRLSRLSSNSSNTEDQKNKKGKKRHGKDTSDSADDEEPSTSHAAKRRKKPISMSQISSDSEEEREKETPMAIHDEPISPCPPPHGGSGNEEPSVIVEFEKAISSNGESSSSDLFVEVVPTENKTKKLKKRKVTPVKPLPLASTVCDRCHKEFRSSTALVHHMLKMHKDDVAPLFKCGFCERKYKRRDMFNKHVRTHKKT